MKITPIHTTEDYEKALSRIDALMDAALDTEEGDELEIWVTLVEAYEEKHFQIAPPDPIEAIKFRMEQMGMKNSDLQKILKSNRGRVSEILNKRRHLSLTMIRKLSDTLHIPPEVLIRQYSLKPNNHTSNRKH